MTRRHRPHSGMAFRRVTPANGAGHWVLVPWAPDVASEAYACTMPVHGEACNVFVNRHTGTVHAQVRARR